MTETNESVGLDCQYCDGDIEMTDVTGHYSGVCKKCRQKIDREQSAFGVRSHLMHDKYLGGFGETP